MSRKSRRDIYNEDAEPAFTRALSWSETDNALYGQKFQESIESLDLSTNALTFGKEGRIEYKRFQFSRTSIVIPSDVTIEEMEELGKILMHLQDSVQWWIGDWINEMEDRKWKETYQKMAYNLDYEVNTLYDFASIAGRVKPTIRNPRLSFGHHRIVAKMKESEQREWLTFAEDNDLSIKGLREAIRAAKGDTTPAMALLRRSYRSFENRQKELADQLSTTEKREIADMLRRLADEIESGK